MTKGYSLVSEIEPSDEQLDELMKAVLTEVKHRAIMAQERFEAMQKEQINLALNRIKEKKNA